MSQISKRQTSISGTTVNHVLNLMNLNGSLGSLLTTWCFARPNSKLTITLLPQLCSSYGKYSTFSENKSKNQSLSVSKDYKLVITLPSRWQAVTKPFKMVLNRFSWTKYSLNLRWALCLTTRSKTFLDTCIYILLVLVWKNKRLELKPSIFSKRSLNLRNRRTSVLIAEKSRLSNLKSKSKTTCLLNKQ